MKLSNSDLQRILFSINQLNSDHDPASLPNRTMDSVKSLVAADVVSFEGFGTDNNYEGPLWFAPVANVTTAMLASMSEYVSDHPCFDGVAASKLENSVRVSDYLPLAKFKQTTIYNEFFRQLGTDRQLVGGLHVSQELTITCSLCRLQKDYSERDCRAFDLLAPHLTAAFRQAQFFHRLRFESEQVNAALESAKLAVLTVDKDLNTQTVSATVGKLLVKYFGESALLSDELRRYIKHHHSIFVNDEFYYPPTPFEKNFQNEKLIIRLTFHPTSRTTILFLEEFSRPSITNYAVLGLTNRESEVLFWIGQGKTDGDIGKILDISVRTVQKHVENLFRKLGVETRTSAASKIL